MPPDSPGFGELVPCPGCGPSRSARRRAERIPRWQAESELPHSAKGVTFDSFRRYAGNEQAFAAAQVFAASPGTSWLVLSGPPGNGKTHLLAAVANLAIQQGIPTRYAYVPDLLDWLRAGYGLRVGQEGEGGDFEQRFERVRTAPLLLLDDLGAQKATEWAVEKLESLVDYRYRERLPLAVTTNADVSRVRDLSERVYSRLCRYEDAIVVHNSAEPWHTAREERGE